MCYCRRLRGRLGEQITCRLTEAAPFNHYGMDIFSSFIVKQRRSEVTQNNAIFT